MDLMVHQRRHAAALEDKPRVVHGGNGTWWVRLRRQSGYPRLMWEPHASWREAIDRALSWSGPR